MKRKMLILTNRTLHNGPRMIREFQTFQHDFEITAIGTSKPTDQAIHYRSISESQSIITKILNAIFRRLFYKKLTKHIAEYSPAIEKFIEAAHFDVIIIHEPNYLPLLSRLKKTLPFIAVYNAHEYHPLEFEDIDGWKETIGQYPFTLYQKYLKDIDLLVNVCDGIAQKCKQEFGKESLVVPNVAIQSDVAPVSNTGIIKLIYHGALMQSRHIEDMIDVMYLLGSNYQLDIMGTVSKGNEAYLNYLQAYAKKTGNVNFIPPVDFDRIIPFINTYDIGLFLLRPNNFNYAHALPNKLYEFIQAKLAIAIGPSAEMKAVVDQYDLGVVSDDFTPDSLAAKIRQLNREDIQRYKMNAITASKIENAAIYSARYLEKINSLLR